MGARHSHGSTAGLVYPAGERNPDFIGADSSVWTFVHGNNMARAGFLLDGVVDDVAFVRDIAPGRAKRLGVISRNKSAFMEWGDAAIALDVNVFWCRYLHDAVFDALDAPMAWSALVIKFGDYGSVSSLFNFLRSVRSRCPELPIILANEAFSADDFSCERLALCDASLRLPADSVGIEAAVRAAVKNNGTWVERMHELHALSG